MQNSKSRDHLICAFRQETIISYIMKKKSIGATSIRFIEAFGPWVNSDMQIILLTIQTSLIVSSYCDVCKKAMTEIFGIVIISIKCVTHYGNYYYEYNYINIPLCNLIIT